VRVGEATVCLWRLRFPRELVLVLTMGLVVMSLVMQPDGAPDGLVAYLPFDGTAEVALGTPAGTAARATSEGHRFAPGRRGGALQLVSDCRYDIGHSFPTAEGTFAAWVKPEWPAEDAEPHYLLCLYGAPSLESSWARNRWTVMLQGGRVTFNVYRGEPNQPAGVSAEIPGWLDGQWHHIAATWARISSGADDATLRLYLDGAPAAEATGLRIDVGETSTVLDIGRDSDASPDYGQALIDDVFIYGRALSPEEIAAGVAAPEPPMPVSPATAMAPEGWAVPDLPFRALIEAPAQKAERTDVLLYTALDLTGYLRDMGLPGLPRYDSARLSDAAGGREVPVDIAEAMASWTLVGRWPAGEARRYQLYFGVAAYAYVAPLVVAGPPTGGPPGPSRAKVLPDYATLTYGDAWDFDEGDLEDIDGFGDKPAFIRDVRVEDGALHASVTQDPYIIWGTMWGPEDKGHRRVRIDVSEFSLLEMRVRQSVPSAVWSTMGRVAGSDSLLRHDIVVSGTEWQTVRADLRRDARWVGPLSALRIDLTNDADADVAIDYVRLLRAARADVVTVETLGRPSSPVARVALSAAQPRPVAGSEQEVIARAEDAAGQPVSGAPVRMWLSPAAGGSLVGTAAPGVLLAGGARRMVTGEDGTVRLRYTAGQRARTAVELHAAAEFPEVAAPVVEAETQAGPAVRYIVGEPGVTIVHEAATPLAVRAFAADACGNPVAVPDRKLTWEVEDGALADAQQTTNQGAASAQLVPDMGRRWVYRVRVRDAAGLEGLSDAICILPKGAPDEKVTLAGNGRFTAGGRAFTPLGGFYAVWVPQIPPEGEEEGRRIRAFTDATEEEMAHWFAYLKSQGVNALRMMLRTHGPDGTEAMDIGGRVNRKLFAKVLRMLDIARQSGLRFMLTLHDDYDKPVYCNERHLRNFALPAFAGEDLDALPPYQRRFIRDIDLLSPPERYTDPDAIACQDQYEREIVGYLKDNPCLFSWEMENEMVDCPAAWVDHAVSVIREVDPVTPVCVSHGGGGVLTADPAFWTRTSVDFYTYHLYPRGTTTPDMDYGVDVDVLARYGRMAGPCFLGESSGDEFSQYPVGPSPQPSPGGRGGLVDRDDDRRYIMRDIIWFSLVNGNPGCFFWNARGKEIEEFRLARTVLDEIDWTAWARKQPSVAVLVPHTLQDDKYFRSPEGQASLAMMGRYAQHFLTAGVDFDFALEPDGYAQTCGLAEFSPPQAAPVPIAISPGFQIASTTRADGKAGLAYVRCYAGTRAWSPDQGTQMYLRNREAAPLSIRLALPVDSADLQVWDLDTREMRRLSPRGDGTVDLGTTDHDFALLWRIP